MAVQLTSKQELFAQLISDPDQTYCGAYRMAYDVDPETPDETIYPNASRLAKHNKIEARLREIRQAQYSHEPWTSDKLRVRLEDRSDQAADAKQYGPSVRALEMIGKLDNLIVDKREVAVSGSVSYIQLSTDELRQLVEAGQRISSQYGLESPRIVEAEIEGKDQGQDQEQEP